MSDSNGTVRTRIPARMDRLPWCSWHWLVVFGLAPSGSSTASRSRSSDPSVRASPRRTRSASRRTAGLAGTIYVLDAASGALFWGHLTDRFGRKKLFLITLAVYLVATVATAFASSFLFFAICRFFTGFGIGGEYAAINSAITS